INTFALWSQGGMGYASFQWYDSEAMAYLRELPADIKIYTNEPAAVYLYVGRGAKVLPARYDSATLQAHSDFDEGIANLHDEINSGQAVIALFDSNDKLGADISTLTDGLHVAYKGQGDLIYTAGP
ncbi:MAG TPA: hypothetical protein VJ972_10790, partial [Anaerolineales bacterium]|nr:hypothetical protein [Anaerolineales bacterium]